MFLEFSSLMLFYECVFSVGDCLELGRHLLFGLGAVFLFRRAPVKPPVALIIGCTDGWLFVHTGHKAPGTISTFWVDLSFVPKPLAFNPALYNVEGFNLGLSPDAPLTTAIVLTEHEHKEILKFRTYDDYQNVGVFFWGDDNNHVIHMGVGFNCYQMIALLHKYANNPVFRLYCSNGSVDLGPALDSHGLTITAYLLPLASAADYSVARRLSTKSYAIMAISAVSVLFAPSVVSLIKSLSARDW